MIRRRSLPVPSKIAVILGAIALLSGGAIVWAIVTDYALVETLHPEKAEHLDQSVLVGLARANHQADAFAIERARREEPLTSELYHG